jgi:hypothetical protein
LSSYLEYQFGQKVTGIDYRERKSGEHISNWEVEVVTLYHIYRCLTNIHLGNDTLSMNSRHEMCFPYIERSLSLLNPWLIQLDLDSSDRTDSRNDHQIEILLEDLFRTEQQMAALTININQFDIAEGHCQRCLAYSRRYGLEGEKKITDVFGALRIYRILRERQKDYSGAVNFAEQAYKLVVEAYDCAHPQVFPKCRKLLEY